MTSAADESSTGAAEQDQQQSVAEAALTRSEIDVCTMFFDNFQVLTFGYDSYGRVGMKDVSSGGGGVTGRAHNMMLIKMNLEATRAAATDPGPMAAHFLDFSRSQDGHDEFWQDQQAMAVGHYYVKVLLHCKDNGVDVDQFTVDEWRGLTEWVTGFKTEDLVSQGLGDPEEICTGLAQAKDGHELALALEAQDTASAPTLAALIGASSLSACPSRSAVAAGALDEILADHGWLTHSNPR